MSNYGEGALLGAMILSDQISADRLLDSFQRSRERTALERNDAAWCAQYNELVERHNRLAEALDQARDTNQSQAREVDRLERRIRHAESEYAALRVETEKLEGLNDLTNYMWIPECERLTEENEDLRKRLGKVGLGAAT